MKRCTVLKRPVSVGLTLAVAAAFFLVSPMEATPADKEVLWNVSVWGGVRAGTRPMHDYAADMEKLTGGKWKIKFHYGEVLSPAKEKLDGLRSGLYEAAYFSPSYAPGKTPLHMVHDLPFIAPSDNLHMGKLWVELWKHPAMKKELLKWNAVPLLPNMLPVYNLMGTKAIRTVEDLKGYRVRVGGEIAKVLRKFGAVPTMVPAPELYETLSRGTLDGVSFPWTYAFGSYRIHEISQYAIVLSLGALSMLPVASKTAWDALPEEWKKYHMEWYYKAPEKWAAEYQKADDEWLPVFKKHLEIIELPDSERAKLIGASQEVYDAWIDEKEKAGLPGKEIFDYYLQKRKEIAGY